MKSKNNHRGLSPLWQRIAIFACSCTMACEQAGGFLVRTDGAIQPVPGMTMTSTTNTSSTADAGVIMTVTDPRMTFFVTSRTVEVNGQPVQGGNLGGLAGADEFCTQLASEALPGNDKTWRAYLSSRTVDAIDRIGSGPWFNANGEEIASNVAELISMPPLESQLLDETNLRWNERPGALHDVLTGSDNDGRKFGALNEMTMGFPNPGGSLFNFPDGSFSYQNVIFDFSCNDWTSNTNNSYAVVGHVDWNVLTAGTGSDQWTTSHVTGCALDEMRANGGQVRLYCFAID
ncbi:MAG: hypothetical protein VYC39_04165 [Myxococcota bacterium]|nr:hypothetical protein [Myxococcota bacterium]